MNILKYLPYIRHQAIYSNKAGYVPLKTYNEVEYDVDHSLVSVLNSNFHYKNYLWFQVTHVIFPFLWCRKFIREVEKEKISSM